MEVKELFRQAVSYSTRAISLVQKNDFDKPTPDTEWDVYTLAGHMLYELYWTADIVSGASIGEVGDKYDGDLIGDNLLAGWQQAAQAALKAVADCDLNAEAHLSYGNVTNEYYLREAAADQLIHAWDLSAALGRPVQYEPAVAEVVYKETIPKRPMLTASGLFGTPLDVPEDAGVQTKLLGIYGRDAAWTAPQQASLFQK